MEPKSGFYGDPVAVLDFQSLYPSMIIAYNLCYSTIVGKMTKGTKGIYTSNICVYMFIHISVYISVYILHVCIHTYLFL